MPSVWDGSLTKSDQVEAFATHAAKMSTAESRIDFETMGASTIHNRCRAFAGWPGIWSLFSIGSTGENIRIKIITTTVIKAATEGSISNTGNSENRIIQFITYKKQGMFKVTCFDGSELGILELQPPGRFNFITTST